MNTASEARRKATEPKKTVLPRDKWLNIGILAVLTIAGIVISIKFDWAAIEAFMQANPSWTIVISLVVYTLLGLTVIPTTPLVVIVALNIGLLPAILVSGTGQTLASWLEYYQGRLINYAIDLDAMRSKLPQKVRDMPIASPMFQLAARVIVPKPLALLSGAYRVPLGTYLGISLLENTFGSAIFGLTGLGILNLVIPG
jgi:membrane protein YqaA with SNARE-associated domain